MYFEEQGPHASAFIPRRTVEAALAGRRQRALIHLDDTLLEPYLTTYNQSDEPAIAPFILRISEFVGNRDIFA